MPSKTFLVFCDGTRMDGDLANDLGLYLVEDGESTVQYATNVLYLSRPVKSETIDVRRQIVFYRSGVGSGANFEGDSITGTILLQALGDAEANKIRDFITQNFEHGDEICILGDADTARKLSDLIDEVGLLESETLESFSKIWKELIDGKAPSITGRLTRLKRVGVWDTVGSIYSTIDAINLKDTDLPKTISVVLRGLPLQENRQKFLPTLWSIGLSSTANGNQQVFKQIWLPGFDSDDVGGGYEHHGPADIALFWMDSEVEDISNFDLASLRQSGRPQPHIACKLPLERKLVVSYGLESSQITKDTSFHKSLFVSPTTLKDSSYIVTVPILKQKFGSTWVPNNWMQFTHQQPALCLRRAPRVAGGLRCATFTRRLRLRYL